MRRYSLTRILVITLTILVAIGVAATAQESGTTQPKKKKPQKTPEPATQTAPATQSQPASQGKGKSKAQDPKEAGWQTVQGRIITVQPGQNTLIIQTNATQYQIHVTAQTQILRDGKPAELKEMKMNDRVDGCHFNSKHVAQSLKVTSAENVLKHPNTNQ